jgi:hypothetical protein
MVKFTANEDYTLVNFLRNKYISYLDYFKWNKDPKTLEREHARQLRRKLQQLRNMI